jgi:CTP:molybdopterin cytidylyltransferase MocA
MIIGAVTLAAGKSERMGQNKLLLRLNGKVLIVNILDALAAGNIDEQVVVLGHKAAQVIEAIKPRLQTVKVVINEELGRFFYFCVHLLSSSGVRIISSKEA